MITESCIYKKQLLKISGNVTRKLEQARWLEKSYVNFEKDVLVSFYIIRKLIEAKTKLTKQVTSMNIALTKYPLREENGKPSILNNHKIEKFYNLDSSTRTQLSLAKLCNLFVHSFIFQPVFDEHKKLSSIFITSDHQNNSLLLLKINKYINILNRIGNNYPKSIIIKRNEDGNLNITCA